MSTDTQQQSSERGTQMLAMIQSMPSLIESLSDSDDSTQEPKCHKADSLTRNNNRIQLEIFCFLTYLRTDSHQNTHQNTQSTGLGNETCRKTPNRARKCRADVVIVIMRGKNVPDVLRNTR